MNLFRGLLLTNFPFTPRQYQLNGRYEVNKIINAGNHPLLVMPTGTGKTKTSAMIIYDQIQLGKTVYVICPQVEIFEQLLNDYSFMNPGYVNDEGMKGKDRSIYVCMALSLVNILPLINQSDYPDVIIVDEAHHSAADTWEEIYTFFYRANRVGMTATPVRTDGKPLGHLYTEIVEPITIKEAILQGFLTTPIVIGPEEFQYKIPLTDDIDEKVQAELLGTAQIIGDVIEAYDRVLNGLPMLIACCTYGHAEKVRDSFRDAGWIADHIHSGLSKADRKSMLNRVRSGKTNILTTVGIGIEGLDISGIYALAWLRRTESTTIKVQFEGRPMRLGENKDFCFIFDFVGNCVIHGMPDRVRKWDLEKGDITDGSEDKIDFRKCPDCGVYNHIDNLECHWCGADLSEEGRKDGTCRRCKNWKGLDGCSVGGDYEKWLLHEGCESFKVKGRSLPAMIDGKLVAINTAGEIQELRDRVKEKKEEIAKKMIEEEEKKNSLEEIDSFEKRRIIQKGLFADGMQRSLFREALEG